jgi:DNA polymerase-4
MDATLSYLTQKAMKRLREAGLSASTVSLTIRYQGFETITRARTLREPTHLDPIVFEAVNQLFDRNWDRKRKVRLLGVALTSFTHGGEQLDLIDGQRREKLERLAQATDALRDRFGFSKVQFGGSMTKSDKRNEEE